MAVFANSGFRDDLADLNETRKAIENAENRARLDQKKKNSKVGRRNDREYAQALHREADQLYHSGDYETALVLYHRAANLFPRDSSHSVAARRTAATISSCNNPSKALRRGLPSARDGERLTVNLCPESAAMRATDKLKKSPDAECVVEVLSYFDNHKSFWRTTPSPRPLNTQVARSKMMVRQLNNLANASLENLEAAFNSGKMSAALKIAQELLMLSAGFQDPSRYQIAAYHYLSLIHVALGRHDRAVCSASRLVRLAKSTQNVIKVCQALVTMGKVHLSFGHLNAAAKAWEHLSSDLKEPIPRAWIRHEIGRCHLETEKYRQALEMASRCVEAAVEGNSKKWMLHGKLLMGQSLAKMGRFAEALEELQIAAKIAEEEGDTPMLSYIRDFIDQVTRALQRITFEEEYRVVEETKTSPRIKEEEIARQSSLLVAQAETIITTMFSQRKVIREYRDGGCSSETSLDVDEEITMHSDKTRSLAQSCRGISVRSDLDEDQDQSVLQGSSTSRVRDSASTSRTRDDASSFSSCSSVTLSGSFSDVECTEEVEDFEEDLDKLGDKEESNTEELQRGSSTSMKSANTTATYVIEEQEESLLRRTKRVLDNEEQKKGIARVFDRNSKGEGVKDDPTSDKVSSEKEGMLNALRVMEELKKKNEVELLEMVRDMVRDTMLTQNEDDRECDFGNSGDTNREDFVTPRSSEDSEGMRTFRKYSLPSSPRKCDADGDFHDRGATLESN